jgi:hypothetical protein
VLDWHQPAIGLHQLRQHVLENVLGVSRIGDASADEAVQTRLLSLDDFGDATIRVPCHALVLLLM